MSFIRLAKDNDLQSLRRMDHIDSWIGPSNFWRETTPAVHSFLVMWWFSWEPENSLSVRFSKRRLYLVPRGDSFIMIEYRQPENPILHESGKTSLGQFGFGMYSLMSKNNNIFVLVQDSACCFFQ